MPREARQKLNSKFFHVMVQGVNKEYIFNKEQYMKKYQEFIFLVLKKYNKIKMIAYCIMNNHAHILFYVERIEELSKFMKSINVSFSMYYNTYQNRVGVVFRNRFESEPIIDEKHLKNCISYIHNNPVKAGIVEKAEQYKYSSCRNYIEGSVDFGIIELIFGNRNNYIENIKNMNSDNEEYKFKECVEKKDYNEIINDITCVGMEKILTNEKLLNNTIRKLINEEKVPIKIVCEKFKLSRYMINKILKKVCP